MKRMMCLLAVLAVICAGCANVRPFIRAQADGGAGVGVALGAKQEEGSFVGNHWGKLLTAVAAGAALDRIAENNGWLWYDGGNGARTVTVPAGENRSQNVSVLLEGSTGNNITINIGANQNKTE